MEVVSKMLTCILVPGLLLGCGQGVSSSPQPSPTAKSKSFDISSLLGMTGQDAERRLGKPQKKIAKNKDGVAEWHFKQANFQTFWITFGKDRVDNIEAILPWKAGALENGFALAGIAPETWTLSPDHSSDQQKTYKGKDGANLIFFHRYPEGKITEALTVQIYKY